MQRGSTRGLELTTLVSGLLFCGVTAAHALHQLRLQDLLPGDPEGYRRAAEQGDAFVASAFGGRRCERLRTIPAWTETPREHPRYERRGLSGSRAGLDDDRPFEFPLSESSRPRVFFSELVRQCALFATHDSSTPRFQS